MGRKFTQADKCSWKLRCWCTNRSKHKDWRSRPYDIKFYIHDWMNSALSQLLQVIIMNYYVHSRNHNLFKYFMVHIRNKKLSPMKKQLWCFISIMWRRNNKLGKVYFTIYYSFLKVSGLHVVKCILLSQTTFILSLAIFGLLNTTEVQKVKTTGLLKVIANSGKTVSSQCRLLNVRISKMKIKEILWSY